MTQAVPLLAALLFRFLPPRRAAIAAVLGGWLVLPTARYDASAHVDFPYWVLPASLPADPWATKAVAIGIGALLGATLFDRRSLLGLRPSWFDLPMLGWIVWPAISNLANGLGPKAAGAAALYHALAWGVPYALGRAYFGDAEGRDELARGIVVGGLACVPACLAENVAGPFLYQTVYGFHPFQTQGASRYLGFRPIVFFEDGNQLGAWMATAALVGAWLWRTGRPARPFGLPGGVVAGLVIIAALLTQSAGAVLLLGAALAGMEAVLRTKRIWPLAVPLLLVPALLGARALNLVDAKALAQKTAAGRAAISTLGRLDRNSFGWRLRVEERQARVALRSPIVGRGRWDWWRPAEERPWGLPGLALGMYGLPGWALLMAVLGTPIAGFLARVPGGLWGSVAWASTAALAGALALNALDAILNGAYLLPLGLAAGGLAVGTRASGPVPKPVAAGSPHQTYRIVR